MQNLAATKNDIQEIRNISIEAAKLTLRLTDLTNQLSAQEKEMIKNRLKTNQKLFVQVSNFAPQIYMMTKSKDFLKEVFQLRIFVKEILEKCAKGIYVVKLDTVDKLVMKYQRYWESMKVQLLRRQAQSKQHDVQGTLKHMQKMQSQAANFGNPAMTPSQMPEIPQDATGAAAGNFRSVSTPAMVSGTQTPNENAPNFKQGNRGINHQKNVSLSSTTSGSVPENPIIIAGRNTSMDPPKDSPAMANKINQTPDQTGSLKQDAERLANMNLQKSEIISRFKHRQKLFITSPIDLFLSTLGDCLGVEGEKVETVYKIPKNVADFINGMKISKTEQRVRNQDSVSMSVVDNKFLMKSKAGPDDKKYDIPASSLSAIYKGIQGPSGINAFQLFGNSSLSPISEEHMTTGNIKKRKIDQSEISPANSNVTTSTDSTMMGESKKARIETPEEPLLSANNNNTATSKQSNGADNLNAGNIWDWNYWESALT